MAESATPSRGRIFISYRREETAYPAGWLYDRLAGRYGGQVFKDVDSIQLGDDFVEMITSAVTSCDVLLALVGDQWLTVTDEDGRRRLDDPEDFVRLEIEAALTRNVRVIPILVDGARMPRAEELPPSLARLVRRQALELSPARFDFDFSRLLKVLDRTLAEVRTTHHEAAAASARAGKTPDTTTTEPPRAQASRSDAQTAQPGTAVSPYDDPEYTAALAAYFTERWDPAVDLLTQVLEKYPDHPQATERLAEARRQRQLAGWDAAARQAAEHGRWDVAVEALERLAAAQPDRPDTEQRLEHARRQQKVTRLQDDLRRLHTAEQWAAVIAIGEQLAELDPRLADPDGLVTAARTKAAEAAIADRYKTGLLQLDRGDLAAAAATFAAIEAERAGYRDTAALLARIRTDQPAQIAAEQEPPRQEEVPASWPEPQPMPDAPSPPSAALAEQETVTPHYAGEPTGPVPGHTETPSAIEGGKRLGIRHVLWALIPVLSFGLLVPVPFVHAAIRLHDRRLWLITAAYVTAWLPLLIVAIANNNVGDVLLLALVVVATVHAWRLRHRVFAEPSASPPGSNPD